jgi:hypothetical protein
MTTQPYSTNTSNLNESQKLITWRIFVLAVAFFARFG